jgi:hypothetical protein
MQSDIERIKNPTEGNTKPSVGFISDIPVPAVPEADAPGAETGGQ